MASYVGPHPLTDFLVFPLTHRIVDNRDRVLLKARAHR